MEIETLGIMRTCFPEKFGIPRQPGLAPLARGVLRFKTNRSASIWRDAMRGLEGFSHIWVTFVFHRAVQDGWKSLVRPPRLGGKEKMGVWATRSPHRPNFLGMSLLEIESIDLTTPSILFKGVDLLDGTPVVDVRPFHPDHDLPKGVSRDGWIAHAPEPSATVCWTRSTHGQLSAGMSQVPLGMPEYTIDEAKSLVESVLALDPRPGHMRGGTAEWAMRVLGFDVKFRMEGNHAEIFDIGSGTEIPRAVLG